MPRKSQEPDYSKLSDDELDRLLEIKRQLELERVAPKFEEWRNKYRYKIAYGGRGAGAKTWSYTSLLVQRANEKKTKILSIREIQKSIEESSYTIIKDTIARLRYPDWKFTEKHIENTRNGSIFSFAGAKDARATDSIKSYENYDILAAEEAQSISHASWNVLLPTFRKPGSEIWAVFNRTLETDPVYEIFVKNPRPRSCVLKLEPGKIDNPWFTKELEDEMAHDYDIDPDEAAHKWGGLPRKQGLNAVMSREAILEACSRAVDPSPDDDEQIGCDVARFGDDTTQMYRRKGMKIVDHKELIKASTDRVANELWDFGGRNPYMRFLVDVGAMGAGVIDQLRRLGAENVVEIGFGANAADTERYADCASEMWFTFPVARAQIPDDLLLVDELAGRRYGYVKGSGESDRRKVEPKGDYKKRLGRSPDKADALIMTYYDPGRGNAALSYIDASDIGL